MGNELTKSYDASKLEDIFLEDNGVGNSPIAKEWEEIGAKINPEVVTPQELRFCQLMIKGVPKPDAYIQAFNRDPYEISREGFSVAARRLLKRPRVQAKYKDLQERMQGFLEEDLAKQVYQLNEAYGIAESLGQPSAMVSAVKVKANLLGLEHTNNVTNNVVVNLGENQKQQLLSRLKTVNTKQGVTIDGEFEEN